MAKTMMVGYESRQVDEGRTLVRTLYSQLRT